MKLKYYSLKNILSKNAVYNLIIGERSNGKTYSVQEYIIRKYFETGEAAAIIRRYDTDFKGKNGQDYFLPLVNNNIVSKYSHGEYDRVVYYRKSWRLGKYNPDEEKIEMSDRIFAYAYSLTTTEHDKGGGSGDKITTVLFDEFLTRSYYLPDEFVLFMNTLSTIIRQRDNVKIFMLGNTVNKYCPYFAEMGLTNVSKMHKGDIDVYCYGNSALTVAVEYSDGISKNGKPSDKYFAFDNPKLKMITNGTWEIDIYPHCPTKYAPKNILFTYFIIFNGETLQCEIVNVENNYFTFIHRKTTPIKNNNTDLIYTPDYNSQPNYRRKITKPVLPIEKRITEFFVTDKVFYQDNETGEIVRNYLQFCVTDKRT